MDGPTTPKSSKKRRMSMVMAQEMYTSVAEQQETELRFLEQKLPVYELQTIADYFRKQRHELEMKLLKTMQPVGSDGDEVTEEYEAEPASQEDKNATVEFCNALLVDVKFNAVCEDLFSGDISVATDALTKFRMLFSIVDVFKTPFERFSVADTVVKVFEKTLAKENLVPRFLVLMTNTEWPNAQIEACCVIRQFAPGPRIAMMNSSYILHPMHMYCKKLLIENGIIPILKRILSHESSSSVDLRGQAILVISALARHNHEPRVVLLQNEILANLMNILQQTESISLMRKIANCCALLFRSNFDLSQAFNALLSSIHRVTDDAYLVDLFATVSSVIPKYLDAAQASALSSLVFKHDSPLVREKGLFCLSSCLSKCNDDIVKAILEHLFSGVGSGGGASGSPVRILSCVCADDEIKVQHEAIGMLLTISNRREFVSGLISANGIVAALCNIIVGGGAGAGGGGGAAAGGAGAAGGGAGGGEKKNTDHTFTVLSILAHLSSVPEDVESLVFQICTAIASTGKAEMPAFMPGGAVTMSSSSSSSSNSSEEAYGLESPLLTFARFLLSYRRTGTGSGDGEKETSVFFNIPVVRDTLNLLMNIALCPGPPRSSSSSSSIQTTSKSKSDAGAFASLLKTSSSSSSSSSSSNNKSNPHKTSKFATMFNFAVLDCLFHLVITISVERAKDESETYRTEFLTKAERIFLLLKGSEIDPDLRSRISNFLKWYFPPDGLTSEATSESESEMTMSGEKSPSSRMITEDVLISLKLVFKREIRLAKISRSAPYSELEKLISDKYGQLLTSSYRDEDGDYITVGSLEDWEYCVSKFLLTGGQFLRLYLTSPARSQFVTGTASVFAAGSGSGSGSGREKSSSSVGSGDKIPVDKDSTKTNDEIAGDGKALTRRQKFILRMKSRTLYSEEELGKLFDQWIHAAEDGKHVSFDRFRIGMNMMGLSGASESMLKQTFRAFDLDGDEMCSIEEIVRGLSVIQRGSQQDKLSLAFRAYDRDRSGFISKADLFAIFKAANDASVGDEKLDDEMLSSLCDSAFSAIDTNKDGTLQYSEFCLAVEKGNIKDVFYLS